MLARICHLLKAISHTSVGAFDWSQGPEIEPRAQATAVA